MSKKDFIAIAATLNANRAPLALVEDMADTLADTNPLFDRERFIAASTEALFTDTTYTIRRLAEFHN